MYVYLEIVLSFSFRCWFLTTSSFLRFQVKVTTYRSTRGIPNMPTRNAPNSETPAHTFSRVLGDIIIIADFSP